MQLKMSEQFNMKVMKEMLEEENKFLSDIFAKMQSMYHIGDPEPEPVGGKSHGTKGRIRPVPGGVVKRARTFEELHAKLDELKGVKKLEYKDKLLKKNLKTKIKKKTKREDILMQKKMARTEQLASGMKRLNMENEEAPKVPRPKPVFNSEGKMVFSKFDFSEIGAKKKLPKSEKDPKKILQQLQEKKKKIKELEQSGEKEKALEIKEKEAWKAVLAKSSGEKVKDDPELLKRTISRQEHQKKHSAKKWKSRLEGVQKSIQERQTKRQENIQKRKKDKKVTKLKKASKKGRVIPGY